MFAARYFPARYFPSRYFTGTSTGFATCLVVVTALDQTGTPIENAIVRTWLEDGNSIANGAAIGRGMRTVRTDASGQVTIPMIPLNSFSRGGTYILQVSDPSGRRLHEARVRVPLLDTCTMRELTEI